MAQQVVDESFIRSALERYEQVLVGYALRYTGDLETARDVVQDTFLRLCKTDRSKVDGHLGAWLFTVCRNRALDVIKKEGRMQPLSDGQANTLASSAADPLEAARRQEEHRLLVEALDGLPEDQRKVFHLKFQRGLTYRQISADTGHSLGQISKLMAHAMESLREQLRGKLELAPNDRG